MMDALNVLLAREYLDGMVCEGWRKSVSIAPGCSVKAGEL